MVQEHILFWGFLFEELWEFTGRAITVNTRELSWLLGGGELAKNQYHKYFQATMLFCKNI